MLWKKSFKLNYFTHKASVRIFFFLLKNNWKQESCESTNDNHFRYTKCNSEFSIDADRNIHLLHYLLPYFIPLHVHTAYVLKCRIINNKTAQITSKGQNTICNCALSSFCFSSLLLL